MTRSKIATYPLALYVPPIHHKGLLPSEVAELTYQARGRFISACNETLELLDLTMDEPTFASVKDVLELYGIGVGRTKNVITERSIAVCEGYELK